MSRFANEHLNLAIGTYHEGTLDAAGSQVLVEALRGADAKAVRDRLALDGLLAQAFTADDAVVRSVRERLAAERSASAVVKAVRRSLPSRRSPQVSNTWWSRAAVAALLALVVGGGWWFTARHQAQVYECRVASSGPLVVARDGRALTLTKGDDLFADDGLTMTATTTLVWADGSQVVFGSGSQVELKRPALGPGFRLVNGAASAEIAPQRPGLSFVIATPEARVEVLGTRFHVQAGEQRTRLEVQHGNVRMTRIADGKAVIVGAEQRAIVAEGEDFTVRPIVAATTTPPVTAPVVPPREEPAWKPLFADSGFDGWIMQHGRWSNLHGRIRGEDPHHDKVRLLGQHPFADLELSCRLRITGVDFAEVQVGDYNWFVEVPAKGIDWVQVVIQQRGAALHITADGVKLQLHAGDGQPHRAGPLAFYVMPGGTLEIFDARFRIPPSNTPTTR